MALKEQFARAKTYIDIGDYRNARRILRQIDHPKAQEWLRRVDQIDPRQSEKAIGYILGGVSLITSLIAAFAFIAIIFNPANALTGAIVLLVTVPVAYLTRKVGKNLRS